MYMYMYDTKFLACVLLQDVIGKRGVLALLCCLLTTPVFALLTFSQLHPLFSFVWLGITYSVAAVRVETILFLSVYI